MITKITDGKKIEINESDFADIFVNMPEEKTFRINELKQLLRDTDYVALSDYDKDKTEVIAQRALWREEIRELEND